MKIAICNSNNNYLKMIKNTIYCFAEFKHMDLIVDCYSRGETLLGSNMKYEMIFLCSEPYSKTALEIAKKVRERDEKCAIVFLSKDTSFVLEAFKVKAFRFLTEPIKQSDIIRVMEEFFEMKGYNYYLWVKSGADIYCVNTGEIMYLEANNKTCFIHSEGKQLKCNRTMARVYNVLPESHFLKINRAFIVNIDYVSAYNRQQVYLKNGEVLRVTRNFFEEFEMNYHTQRQPISIN